MPDAKDYIEKMHGTDWWTRFIVIAIIVLTVIFVREVLEIFRIYQTEPAFVIAMVGTVVAGEFSILYFIFRNKKEIVKESIRYERDYEMIPMMTQQYEGESEGPVSDKGDGFEEVFK